jgi:hypothetical protein
MRTFKDKTGAEWLLDLTVGSVMRLRRADSRFDLFDSNVKVGELPLSTALYDPVLFWELLWHLVEPQAVTRGINAEAFGDLMAAECLIVAQTEFFGEWRDFFHGLQRQDHATALEKVAKYHAKALEMVAENLATVSPKVDAIVNQKMATAMSNGRGRLQALLDSTPDLSAIDK